MVVYPDMTQSYNGDHTTHSSFKVDSHQARNTRANITSLRNYCIEKSGCDDVPTPPMEKREFQEYRSLEAVERQMGL